VVSAAIDRHVHMHVGPASGDRFELDHLEREEVHLPDQIRHPILRAALSREWDGRPLALRSRGDVPPGTGLGSSAAYTVCAIKALSLARGEELSAGEIAEQASEIEIDVLGRNVGKQDQYVSAHGGVCVLEFLPDDTVEARRLELGAAVLEQIHERFLLVSTGRSRSASAMLASQVSRAGDPALDQSLHRTKELAREICSALERGDLGACGELLNGLWEAKRERAPDMAGGRVEELRDLALAKGACGAMVMGAGGGGFLLVQSDEPAATRRALEEAGAPELHFRIDPEGCTGSRSAG
jgi:D-glycero-alpha-D-manno-heptose-7-phosphate kinase